MTDSESLDDIVKKYKETRKRIKEFEDKAQKKRRNNNEDNDNDDPDNDDPDNDDPDNE